MSSVNPSGADIYGELLGLPPRPRMAAGFVAVLGGVATTLYLWDHGVIWGLPLFASIGGIVLFISGFRDLRRREAFENLFALVKEREGELVAAMMEAKRKGESPVRWLTSQGIVDAQIRAYLLERVKDREQSPS